MGIDLSKTVLDVFGTIGASINNVLKSVTYTHQTSIGTYDPVTDTVTATKTTYNLTNSILTGFKDKEKISDFASTSQRGVKISPEIGDMKLLVPYKSLPVIPTHQDKVVINSVTWEVVGYSIDPTGSSLITLLIRSA